MRRLSELERRLEAALQAPLPGVEAQLRLAPTPRPGWRPGESPGAARPAAALLLLFPVDADVRLLLTVRSSTLPNHAGQVSLPGGAVEPGETIEQAALREAFEEVGVPPGAVRLLGRLTPLHIPVSGYVLHPVVGTTHLRHDLLVAATEVEQVIEPRLDDLLDPGCIQHRPLGRDGAFQDVPFFAVEGFEVWGATAMVLSEFLAVVSAVT
jgi:8-oxo-dGTP pyrophosphatase MutT (NUDIX family)